MQKLLETKKVQLSELKVVYDVDHRMNTIQLTCNPSEVEGTGRRVTEKQLAGIFTALYDQKYEPMVVVANKNYLRKPVNCTLVFSENTLVAIGNMNEERFCQLQNGEVVDEITLYKFCKESIKRGLTEKIQYHTRMLNEYLEKYKKWDN